MSWNNLEFLGIPRLLGICFAGEVPVATGTCNVTQFFAELNIFAWFFHHFQSIQFFFFMFVMTVINQVKQVSIQDLQKVHTTENIRRGDKGHEKFIVSLQA